MKNILSGIGRIVLFFVTIAFLAAIGYGVFLLLRGLLHEISALSDNIVAAFVAALTAVFGYMYTQSQSKAKDIAESHRPKKIEIYQGFMEVLMIMMNAARANKPVDPNNPSDDMVDRFGKINSGIILWGSPSIVKAWLQFRQGSKSDKPLYPLILMDDVLRAFRKDLGHSNWGLKKGDLIKIFLKDPEEFDKHIGKVENKKG